MQRLLCLLIFLFIPLSSYGSITVITEAKAGYFRPLSSDIREIYASEMGTYAFDVNFRLAPGVWFWSGLGYWQKKGFAEDDEDFENTKSRISAFPCTLGFKFTKCIFPRLRGFVGAGARYTYLRIKNDFDFCVDHKARGGAGVVFTGGFHLLLEAGLFLVPYFEYSSCTVKFGKRSFSVLNSSVDPGGWVFGVGIGFWPYYF